MMNLLRTTYRRAFRVLLIVLVAGGVFAFGHLMTPRPPDATAEVFWSMGRALEGVPAYMKGAVNEGDVNEVYLNGNTLFYTQYSSNKGVDQLLDYYENLYKGDRAPVASQQSKDWLLKFVKSKEDRVEHARRIEETEKLLNQRYVRVDGDQWGGFATMVTGKEGQADWAPDMKKRFESFNATGKVTDLGDPKIVVAFEDKSTGGSQYLNVWPEEGFNQRALRPRKQEDTPGYDIEDIERPRGSTRLITFGQDQAGAAYSVIMYRGLGTLDSIEHHYRSRMDEQGWGLAPRLVEGRERMEDQGHDPTPSLLFGKDGREAYVSLQENEDDTITSTVVVYRRG